jgi:hypothetical protein
MSLSLLSRLATPSATSWLLSLTLSWDDKEPSPASPTWPHTQETVELWQEEILRTNLLPSVLQQLTCPQKTVMRGRRKRRGRSGRVWR